MDTQVGYLVEDVFEYRLARDGDHGLGGIGRDGAQSAAAAGNGNDRFHGSPLSVCALSRRNTPDRIEWFCKKQRGIARRNKNHRRLEPVSPCEIPASNSGFALEDRGDPGAQGFHSAGKQGNARHDRVTRRRRRRSPSAPRCPHGTRNPAALVFYGEEEIHQSADHARTSTMCEKLAPQRRFPASSSTTRGTMVLWTWMMKSESRNRGRLNPAEPPTMKPGPSG